MAKSKGYKVVSEWTSTATGAKQSHERTFSTKKKAQSFESYQWRNLYGYGTDIKIEIVEL